MATSLSLTGYGPRKALIFDGDETKYELWEVKFLGYMRLQKLYDVVIPKEGETPPSAEKLANAFAELVQCLDDRSLALVIREARDDGRKALNVLREHYQGKGKPRIIALYTELTSLNMKEGEAVTDYILRAEKASAALKAAEEVVSDGLLVAMALKGLPVRYKTFGTVVTQREKAMTFAEFKIALRNFEETEKSCQKAPESEDNVMVQIQKVTKAPFSGKCYRCGRKGHRISDCYSKDPRGKSTKTPANYSQRKNGDTAKKTVNIDSNEHNFAFTFTDDKVSSTLGGKKSNLLLDSGATSHIIVDRESFQSFEKDFDSKNHLIELADGSKASVVLGKGNAKVKLYDINGNLHDVLLNNALYIPSYSQNIFSVSAAVEKGASVCFGRNEKYFKAPDGTKFEVEQKGRLYYLNSISSSKNNASSLAQWHRIMGHCNFQDLRKLESVVNGMQISDQTEFECGTCTQGKMCQTRSRKPDERATAPLEFVHCDLAGPISPVARDGFKYALCFVDDYSGINMVYFLKQKSDTLEATEKFFADVAPYGKVKRIRSDNGGEFMNKEFKSLLRTKGIKHETSCPYSPHQNGSVERQFRTLFEMARCLLLEAQLPKEFWTYAVMTAAYTRNRCFNNRLGLTPLEAFIGKRPDVSNMHVFGTACYGYVQNAKKLEPRGCKGIFVGYDRDSPAYLVYYPESNRVERVRCVKFLDNFCAPETDDDEMPTPLRTVDTEQLQDNSDVVPVEDVTENNDTRADMSQESRYPKRIRNKPKHLDDYALDSDLEDSANYAIDYCYRIANIPTTFADALKSDEATKWQKAMDDEMTALTENDTFELVTPPEGRNIVKSRWVFTVKLGPNGEETFKSRVVAKGYSQTEGIDYQETFAPTARMSSVRMLVQKAVQNDMIIHQMDVKTAYLNAPLDCDIYMEQPEGFEKRGADGEKLVCKLKKSLYGLKQSGRNWNNMLHNYLLSEKFCQSPADPCVYVRNSESGCTILVIWVDDIIISSTSADLLFSVKENLCKKFKMKDLGKLSWFLGTNFKCEANGIEMSQTQYIDKILSKFEMADCKPKSTPCALGVEKSHEESRELDNPGVYRAIVGSLIYVMTGTRPDLCYTVTKLSQAMSKPTQSDLNMAKHVLRYLKGSREQGLKFVKSETNLKLAGFSDSDWGSSVKDRRSITGYNFQLTDKGPLISWKSRKQQTVALSSCEAEYIALANAAQEAKFLKQLCKDMYIACDDVLISVDNQGTINLAKNPVNHQRSKHIDIKYHFIRSEIQNGNVTLQYIPTEDNVADIFTKPVTKAKLEKFRRFIMGI